MASQIPDDTTGQIVVCVSHKCRKRGAERQWVSIVCIVSSGHDDGDTEEDTPPSTEIAPHDRPVRVIASDKYACCHKECDDSSPWKRNKIRDTS